MLNVRDEKRLRVEEGKASKVPCLTCSGKVECADMALRLNSKINNQMWFSLALPGGEGSQALASLWWA